VPLLSSAQILSEHTIKFVCHRLIEIFAAETNVAAVQAPVSVVGDIHGQYFDLVELFAVGGDCPHTNYLFLGDYVDRGPFSVEVISLLCCLKLRHPNRIVMVRGNHESRQTTQVYGFYNDCMKKYGSPSAWQYFCDMFDYLPIAALIDGRIFCVHAGAYRAAVMNSVCDAHLICFFHPRCLCLYAGLSPSLHSIDQVRALERFQEIPHEGMRALIFLTVFFALLH
jgi:serine/threonine-protein phosphatase PPG1